MKRLSWIVLLAIVLFASGQAQAQNYQGHPPAVNEGAALDHMLTSMYMGPTTPILLKPGVQYCVLIYFVGTTSVLGARIQLDSPNSTLFQVFTPLPYEDANKKYVIYNLPMTASLNQGNHALLFTSYVPEDNNQVRFEVYEKNPQTDKQLGQPIFAVTGLHGMMEVPGGSSWQLLPPMQFAIRQ